MIKRPKRDRESEEKRLIREVFDRREEIEAPCSPRLYRVLSRILSNPDNHVAIGFGGGSAHGLAGNVAMVSLLEELDLRAHVKEIWGTSAGGIVGASWATGLSPEKMLAGLEALDGPRVLDFSRWEIFVRNPLRFLFSRRLPAGFIRGEFFGRAITAGLGVERFEETEIPFRVIAATDDGHARKVVFREGPLLPAIRASMCLPGIFDPVPDWNGSDIGYLDGGVVEKTPLVSIIEDHHRLGRESTLVVLCTHFDSKSRIVSPVSFLQRFMSVISHLESNLWTTQVAQSRTVEDCKFMVLNPQMEVGGMLDFSLVEFHYLWAREKFKEQLSNAHLAKRFDAT